MGTENLLENEVAISKIGQIQQNKEIGEKLKKLKRC